MLRRADVAGNAASQTSPPSGRSSQILDEVAPIAAAGHYALASVEHHFVATAGASVHGLHARGIHQLRPADANESGVTQLVREVGHRPANDVLGRAGEDAEVIAFDGNTLDVTGFDEHRAVGRSQQQALYTWGW